jgi:hypothetical protein
LVLDKSLRDYDRLLRRFSADQPRWTKIKKGLSRLLVIVKRLGTGSLVFRLVIWGPILALALVPAAAGIPVGFTAVLITGTVIGMLIAAASYLSAYNLESKASQAGRIVEHLVQFAQLDWLDRKLFEPKESEQDSAVVRVLNSNTDTEELAVINKVSNPIKGEQQLASKDSLIPEENKLSILPGEEIVDVYAIAIDIPHEINQGSGSKLPITQLFKETVAHDSSNIKANGCFRGLVIV